MKLWNDQEFQQYQREFLVTNGNGGFYQQEWMASLNGWMLLICLFWGSWRCFPLILHRILLFWAPRLFIDPIRDHASWGSLIPGWPVHRVYVAKISCPNGPSIFFIRTNIHECIHTYHDYDSDHHHELRNMSPSDWWAPSSDCVVVNTTIIGADIFTLYLQEGWYLEEHLTKNLP